MSRATSAIVGGGLPSCTKASASPNCRFRSISSTLPRSASCQPRLVARKVAPLPPLHAMKASTLPRLPPCAGSRASPRCGRSRPRSASRDAGEGSTSRTPARMELIRNSGVWVEHSRTTAIAGCAGRDVLDLRELGRGRSRCRRPASARAARARRPRACGSCRLRTAAAVWPAPSATARMSCEVPGVGEMTAIFMETSPRVRGRSSRCWGPGA